MEGFTLWFTGLSGSGKSTLAERIKNELIERGMRVELLDGDEFRTTLSKGLGFSKEDRDTNIRRIGFVAAEVVRHGGAAVCAAVSPYRATRDECRERVGADRFLEVFVDTPVEVCESRDSKGLYAKARRGELRGFTGVDDPYEPPAGPELVLHTVETGVLHNARRVLSLLAERGFVLP
jgi:sulfate adenylyltransferase